MFRGVHASFQVLIYLNNRPLNKNYMRISEDLFAKKGIGQILHKYFKEIGCKIRQLVFLGIFGSWQLPFAVILEFKNMEGLDSPFHFRERKLEFATKAKD